VAKRVVSCLKNAQNLAYMHVQFKKFFPVYIARTPLKSRRDGMGREREGQGKEGKGEGGRSCVPNDFSFPCAASAHSVFKYITILRFVRIIYEQLHTVL
jgi:hypothetical protein